VYVSGARERNVKCPPASVVPAMVCDAEEALTAAPAIGAPFVSVTRPLSLPTWWTRPIGQEREDGPHRVFTRRELQPSHFGERARWYRPTRHRWSHVRRGLLSSAEDVGDSTVESWHRRADEGRHTEGRDRALRQQSHNHDAREPRTHPQVPVEGGTGRAVVSHAASTLREEMAMSGQRLLAAGGQISMAAHTRERRESS